MSPERAALGESVSERRRTALLRKAEVARAIWVDYEGSKDKPPTLLGYRLRGSDGEPRYAAALVELRFAACADPVHRVRPITVRDHREVVASLVRQAEQEHRVLVSWSGHDLRLMRDAIDGDADLLQGLDRLWRDARIAARRWRRVAHPGLTGPHSQASYATLLRIRVPPRFAQDVVGRGLREVRLQLSEGRDFARLTTGARKHWYNVLRHNQYDLDTMERIASAVCATQGE